MEGPARSAIDHKLLQEKLSAESIAQETDFSRAMILKGVGPHLQCPGCHRLIQDPRALACSHTYCRGCLDKVTRKTVKESAMYTYSCAVSNNCVPKENGDAGSHSLNYTLQTILGASLDEDLKGHMCDPELSIKSSSSTDKMTHGKKASGRTSNSGASNGKSKKGKKHRQGSSSTKSTASTSSTSTANGPSGSSLGIPTKPSAASSARGTVASKGSDSDRSEVDSERLVEVLVCPECGVHTEIPNGNLSFIPYNFFVQHIMDLMAYYSCPDPIPLVYCSICRKDGEDKLSTAVARCSTCTSFLCKQCFELHSMDDFTKLHATLSITERGESSMFSCLVPDDSKLRHCRTHSNKPFIYYCITCSQGMCETCSKRDHKSHLFSKPEHIQSDFVSYINDLMSRTCQLRRRTEGSVRTSQDLMSGIQLLAATQIEEVLRTQDVLSSTLDARLSVLLQEVDKLSLDGSAKKK